MRVFLAVLLLLVCWPARAATYLLDGSWTNANYRSTNLVDGDTVIWPEGIWNLTNRLVWTNAVSLIFSNNATIIDDYPQPTGTGSGAENVSTLFHFSGANGVTWIDGLSLAAGTRTSKLIFGEVTISASVPAFRISRLSATNVRAGYLIYVRSKSGVIDQLLHRSTAAAAATSVGIDHRNIESSYGDTFWASNFYQLTGTTNMVYIQNSTNLNPGCKNNFTDAYGGAIFEVQQCYLENSSIQNHGTESTDLARGGRLINVISNIFEITLTGITTAPSEAILWRSGGGIVYGNQVIYSGTKEYNYFAQLVDYRRTDYFDRTSGQIPNPGVYPGEFYFGGADGTGSYGSGWDLNDTAGPLGGSLYVQGTHNFTNVAKLLIDTNASWVPNQWAGYQVLNTNKHRHADIISNTSTSVTYNASTQGDDFTFWPAQNASYTNAVSAIDTGTDTLTIGSHTLTHGFDVIVRGAGIPGGLTEFTRYYVRSNSSTTIRLYNSSANAISGSTGLMDITSAGTDVYLVQVDDDHNTMIFDNGDSYQIRNTLWSIDHPGSGPSDKMNGGTRPHAPGWVWINQTNEPIYLWNNVVDGSTNNATVHSKHPTIVEGREWSNNVAIAFTNIAYPHPLIAALELTAPEFAVSVTGNGNPIADGDSSPSLLDHTDFGEVNETGATLDRIYTIYNGGTNAMVVSTITRGGTNPGDWSIFAQPTSPVAAGGSTTFTVRFNPTTTGLRSATLSFTNSDASNTPFNFSIQGTGTSTTTPEIYVLYNAQSIADGDSSPAVSDGTDFASASSGTWDAETESVAVGSVLHTFTIVNLGDGTLTNGVPTFTGTHATDFTLHTAPATTVSPGGLTLMLVLWTPGGTGLREGGITWTNNDASENPFNFSLQGTGISPELGVSGAGNAIANGDTTPSPTDLTDFEDVMVSFAQTNTITLTNTGTQSLELSVSVTGSTDFQVISAPESIDAGESGDLVIRFLPTSGGIHGGQVSIESTDPVNHLWVFEIAGTGFFGTLYDDRRPSVFGGGRRR